MKVSSVMFICLSFKLFHNLIVDGKNCIRIDSYLLITVTVFPGSTACFFKGYQLSDL